MSWHCDDCGGSLYIADSFECAYCKLRNDFSAAIEHLQAVLESCNVPGILISPEIERARDNARSFLGKFTDATAIMRL